MTYPANPFHEKRGIQMAGLGEVKTNQELKEVKGTGGKGRNGRKDKKSQEERRIR